MSCNDQVLTFERQTESSWMLLTRTLFKNLYSLFLSSTEMLIEWFGLWE